jgi:hypothetical protein
MMDQVLKFLANQLDSYLQRQQSNNSRNVVLGNVSLIGSNEENGNLNNQVIISLVNVEEDRISRPVNNYVKVAQQNIPQVIYKNPPVFLNLDILFTAYYSDYQSSLLFLSYIIKFFQYQNVFTTLNAPDLPQQIDEVIFDLKTLSLQDLNNLWGILGSKYIPSVMYKVRLVAISDDFAEGDATLVNEISITDKTMIGYD